MSSRYKSMHRFPEIFIKGSPPLKSRIARMRYLGTLPPEESFSLSATAVLPPATDQKEVQTSPESTFMKGFFTGKSDLPGTTIRPVIKIPSPPLLTSGLLTKAGLVTKAETCRTVSLRGRSVSPFGAEEKTGKNSEFEAKNPPSRRPESVPLPDGVPRNLKPVHIKGRKGHGKSHIHSVAEFDPSDSAEAIKITAQNLASGLKQNTHFRRFSLGEGKLSLRMKALISFSQVFGQPVTEEFKKDMTAKVVEEVFDMKKVELKELKCLYHAESLDYYVIWTGEMVPLTLCCKSPFLLQLSPTSDCRLLCPYDHCSTRSQHSFPLPESYKEQLWAAQREELSSKAISMQIQTGSYRSRSLRSEARSRKVSSKTECLVPAFVDKIRKKRNGKAESFTNEKLQHIRMRATLVDFRRDLLPQSSQAFPPDESTDSSRVFTLPKDLPAARFAL